MIRNLPVVCFSTVISKYVCNASGNVIHHTLKLFFRRQRISSHSSVYFPMSFSMWMIPYNRGSNIGSSSVFRQFPVCAAIRSSSGLSSIVSLGSNSSASSALFAKAYAVHLVPSQQIITKVNWDPVRIYWFPGDLHLSLRNAISGESPWRLSLLFWHLARGGGMGTFSSARWGRENSRRKVAKTATCMIYKWGSSGKESASFSLTGRTTLKDASHAMCLNSASRRALLWWCNVELAKAKIKSRSRLGTKLHEVSDGALGIKKSNEERPPNQA